jgi:hypothetical protein
MLGKIKNIIKNNMLDRSNLTQHSIVLADNRMTRVPENTDLSLNILSHQIPFNELANIILITNSLRAGNINDTVSQIPSKDDPIMRVFETPNFSLRLDALRFICIQKNHFNTFQCGSIMQNLINADITGNTIGYLGSIGVNYEVRLQNNTNDVFNKILQQNAILCNNHSLSSGNFKLSYNINENLLINIQILRKQNQWVVSLNADNRVNADNTIETILTTDFYNIYFVPMYNALFTSNNKS